MTTQTTESKGKKARKPRTPNTFKVCYYEKTETGERFTVINLPDSFKPTSNNYEAFKRAVRNALNAGELVKELNGRQIKIIIDNNPAFVFECEVEEKVIRKVAVKETEIK